MMIKHYFMNYIASVLLCLALTSCSVPPPSDDIKFNSMSDDELCSALGTYNEQGKKVLEIYNELEKRTEKIDNERCHALEIKAKQETDNMRKFNTPEDPMLWKNNNKLPYSGDEMLHRGYEINQWDRKIIVTPPSKKDLLPK